MKIQEIAWHYDRDVLGEDTGHDQIVAPTPVLARAILVEVSTKKRQSEIGRFIRRLSYGRFHSFVNHVPFFGRKKADNLHSTMPHAIRVDQ